MMQGRMKVLIGVLGLALVLLVAGGGVALATHSDPNELHACYKNNNGQMRYVADPSTCLPSETAVSWNQQGSPGPAGLQGLPGASGVSGWEMVEQTTSPSTGYALAQSILCPSAKKVLSGGYRVLGAGRAGVIVMTSQPTGAGNGWYFEAHGDAWPTSTEWNVTLFAVCASVAP